MKSVSRVPPVVQIKTRCPLCLFLCCDDRMNAQFMWLHVGQCVQASHSHAGTGGPERPLQAARSFTCWDAVHSLFTCFFPVTSSCAAKWCESSATPLKGLQLRRSVHQSVSPSKCFPSTHFSCLIIKIFCFSLSSNEILLVLWQKEQSVDVTLGLRQLWL